MRELTPQHLAVLDRFVAAGFEILAFPLYENAIGVRKGNCAALLQPLQGGALKVLVEPSYLVAGNLSVRITRGGRRCFQWKGHLVEVTPERETELAQFAAELSGLLAPGA